MSKKLIAVASAAALALSVLVGVAPASATTTVSGGGNNSGLTAALAKVVTVPADNAVATSEVVTFTVSSAADRTVSATATGGIKLLTTTADADGDEFKSTDGVQTLGISTGVSTSVTFYAFTTSTTASTVVVNDGVGNTQTFYIKGTSVTPYNIAVTAPSSLSTSADGNDLTIVVTDIFGNALETLSGYHLTFSLVGAEIKKEDATTALTTDSGKQSTADDDWDSVAKNFAYSIVSPAATGAAVSIKLSTDTAGTAVPAITGFAKPVATYFKSFSTADLTAQVTALTAQVAALQVIVDRKVTKKRYNTLARKWNRAFPSQKVWVKP
jgi:hypothetical protein